MNVIDDKSLISQAEYAKFLRSSLPKEAFEPDVNELWILLANIAILILGWGIADHLDQWNRYLLWLYLPLSVIMGNSIIVLAFSTHNFMHSKMLKSPLLRQLISLVSLTMLWMPPTLWKAVHNQEHHNKTNSLDDPDRNYLYSQPNSFGKWIQNLFIPSSEVHPFCVYFGIGFVWITYTFRNLASVLLFNDGANQFPVVAFKVKPKRRKAIALELLIMVIAHLSIVTYLGTHPVKLILSYFLPLWIGYAGIIFYIYTNHLLCEMTSINDPLINSVSLRVPKIFDILHFNFSYHTEHHIFPGLNSDYYPVVRNLLLKHYPERFNLLDAGKAWRLLLQTPRHYHDETTFTDWSGKKLTPCPLSRSIREET